MLLFIVNLLNLTFSVQWNREFLCFQFKTKTIIHVSNCSVKFYLYFVGKRLFDAPSGLRVKIYDSKTDTDRFPSLYHPWLKHSIQQTIFSMTEIKQFRTGNTNQHLVLWIIVAILNIVESKSNNGHVSDF